MSLTTKQEIFVQRLLEGNTQAEAYRFAYNCENMKDKTIIEKASTIPKKLKWYEREMIVVPKGEKASR